MSECTDVAGKELGPCRPDREHRPKMGKKHKAYRLLLEPVSCQSVDGSMLTDQASQVAHAEPLAGLSQAPTSPFFFFFGSISSPASGFFLSFFVAPACANMVRSKSLWALRPCLNASGLHNAPRHALQWPGQRWTSSIQQQEDAIAQLPDLNPEALTITSAISLKKIVPPEELVFGRNFTGMPSTPSSPPDLIEITLL